MVTLFVTGAKSVTIKQDHGIAALALCGTKPLNIMGRELIAALVGYIG